MNFGLLREPASSVPPVLGESPSSDAELEAGRQGWYVCAACDERLAREDWVLEHTTQAPLVFANPQGRFFELLLVSHVCGSLFEGHATTEFTWFSGYAWRVGSCEGCGVHIGWHFEATQGDLALREFVALSRAAVKLRSE